MKIQVRHSYALAIVLAIACGDDSDANTGDTEAMATTEANATDQPSSGSSSTSPVESSSSTSSASTGPVAESSSTDAAESSTGGDPFADCTREGLEDDYSVVNQLGMPGAPRWYGPGADEEGNLIDDGKTQYVVTVTYLALRPDADFELLGQLNVANAMALYGNPGLVATQLGGSQVCGSLRTFTVWESEAAMMEFVASKAHLQSISAFPALSRGGSTLSVWSAPVPASEITLDNAMARIADATPYD